MKKGLFGTVLILAGGFLWGTMGMFVKLLSNGGFSTSQITAFRMAAGTAAVWIFIFFYNKKLFRIRLKDLPLFVITGVFCISGTSVTYFTTITHSGMGVAAVLMYFSPVFVIILSRLFFREAVTKPKVAACILAVAGCALVSGVLSIERIQPTYLLTGLASALFYGMYSILSKHLLDRGYHTLTITAYAFLFAAASILFFADIPGLYQRIRGDNMLILYGLTLAVAACALPYILYTLGLSYTQTGKAAIMSSVEPVTAAVLGCVFYREKLDIFQVLGIALVLSSVFVLNVKLRCRGPSQKKQSTD